MVKMVTVNHYLVFALWWALIIKNINDAMIMMAIHYWAFCMISLLIFKPTL